MDFMVFNVRTIADLSLKVLWAGNHGFLLQIDQSILQYSSEFWIYNSCSPKDR